MLGQVLLGHILGNSTQYFHLHVIDQNLVTWLHLVGTVAIGSIVLLAIWFDIINKNQHSISYKLSLTV